MNSTTALPPKAEKFRCSECGLFAASPIVVALHPAVSTGRCSNRRACTRRKLRQSNKAKEAKA